MAKLRGEVAKARDLATEGLCDHYLLLTNLPASGRAAAQIEKTFLAIPRIRSCTVLGPTWLADQILLSSKLRMLVPRLYGIGDLTQILDERRYNQARAILDTYRHEIATFVITACYREAVKSLADHGFVMLLGAPATGKSVIAASLAVGAIDRWNCVPIKAINPAEFSAHWNPEEPGQFFWIDDAFGSNQCEFDLVSQWNAALPHLRAAVQRGTRVVFTSRDYVFRSALHSLRTTVFPLLQDSRVVVDVEGLTLPERQQILYNHVRLGDQSKSFRARLKSLLPELALLPSFLPETARRLGSQHFTKALTITRSGLRGFFDSPTDMLVQILRQLDAPSRAALALLFMEGGRLPIPLHVSDAQRMVVDAIGGSPAAVREALQHMMDTFTRIISERGERNWAFKHPTMHDAMGSYIAEEPDLLDVYLAGATAKRIVGEVVCGAADVKGAKVHVPFSRLDSLCRSVASEWKDRTVIAFLATRCDDAFLVAFLDRLPQLPEYCAEKLGAPLAASPFARLLLRLQKLGRLTEDLRGLLQDSARDCALAVPDASFIVDTELRYALGDASVRGILQHVAAHLKTGNLECVSQWHDGYDNVDDAYAALEEAKEAVAAYRDASVQLGVAFDEAADATLRGIDAAISNLPWQAEEDRDPYAEDWEREALSSERSLFEDVDA